MDNTSGQGKMAMVPDEIKGWSWGAFTLNWIWGCFNKTFIALICLIPYVNFVMAIVLGFKGREWAWKNKKWDSVEHFRSVQKKWDMAGIILLTLSVLLLVLAITIPILSRK